MALADVFSEPTSGLTLASTLGEATRIIWHVITDLNSDSDLNTVTAGRRDQY